MDTNNQYGTLYLQEKLLILLSEFDGICQKNNIPYSLSSGSLLGAIRHGGFIPWDDDIDVTVKRCDYERLKECVSGIQGVVFEKDLWLDRVRYDLNYGPFIPTIDVFIWDNIPDNRLIAKLKYLLIVFMQELIKNNVKWNSGKSFLQNLLSLLLSLIGKLIPIRWRLSWYEKIAQIGNKKDTKYCGGYHDQFRALKNKYRPSMLDHIERHPFESIEVSIMICWDEYLRYIYGDDYMTPPPLSSRVPLHSKSPKVE